MKKLIFFLSMMLFSAQIATSTILINEIMYNPSGSDSGHEWIEIYNNNTVDIDLTGWKFYEADTNHGLTLEQGNAIIPPGGYAVIADDCANFLIDYPNYTQTLFDSSWSSLSNSGEMLVLKNSTLDIIDNVTYSDIADDRNTFCRFPDGDGFDECIVTPGSANVLFIRGFDTGIFVNITSYPEDISSLQVPISFSVHNNNTNSLILDIGAWVSGITTTHWPDYYENQLFQADETKTFDYVINLSEIPGIMTKQLKAGARLSSDHSNTSLSIVNVNLIETIAKPTIDSIFVDPGIPSAESEANIEINFTNPDDDTDYTGNLTVKIKSKITGSWEDYQTIFQDSLFLEADKTKTLSLTWSVPENTLSGLYRVYTRFDYFFDRDTYRTKTENFDIFGVGNIFLTSLEIIGSSDLNLSSTLYSRINITNNESDSHDVEMSLIIEDLRTVSEGKHDETFDCGVYSIENKTTRTIDCSWDVPDDVITNGTEEFDVYSMISFSYDNQTITKTGDDKEINITGLEDLGDPVLEVVSSPRSCRFGDFTTVLVRYETNNYDFPLRFIAYPFSPKHVSMDLDGKTIYQKFCNKDTVVEINASRNEVLYLSLPIFLKRNCDDDYSDGMYEAYARVCKWTGTEWDYMTPTSNYRISFNLSVSGSNDEFCPITVIKTISGGGTLTQEEETTNTTSESPYKIISYPRVVYVGIEFSSEVKLTNTEDYTKHLELYSYVFEGTKLLSEGFDGEKWGRSWTANEKEVTLSPGSSIIIALKNRIKEDVNIGSYNFRVKIKEGDKKKDLTNLIEVQLPTPEILQAQNVSQESMTEEFTTTTMPEEEKIITGRAVGVMDKIMEMIDSLIEWFKGLF